LGVIRVSNVVGLNKVITKSQAIQAASFDYREPLHNRLVRPGKRRALPATPLGACLRQLEEVKASIRAKVEHPFRVIKRQFGDVKSRC